MARSREAVISYFIEETLRQAVNFPTVIVRDDWLLGVVAVQQVHSQWTAGGVFLAGAGALQDALATGETTLRSVKISIYPERSVDSPRRQRSSSPHR